MDNEFKLKCLDFLILEKNTDSVCVLEIWRWRIAF